MTGPLGQADARLRALLNAVGDATGRAQVVEDGIDDIVAEAHAILNGTIVPVAMLAAARGAKQGIRTTVTQLTHLYDQIAQLIDQIRKASEN